MSATRCTSIRPDTRARCDAEAATRVVFVDGDTAWMCEECATYTVELARQHHTSVSVERKTS